MNITIEQLNQLIGEIKQIRLEKHELRLKAREKYLARKVYNKFRRNMKNKQENIEILKEENITPINRHIGYNRLSHTKNRLIETSYLYTIKINAVLR